MAISLFSTSQVRATDQVRIKQDGNRTTFVYLSQIRNKFLLLPIEESAPEVKMTVLKNLREVATYNVHLAKDKIEYYQSFDLQPYAGQSIILDVNSIDDSSACWSHLILTDSATEKKITDYYRPIYHFSPFTGWMNDPNGLVYINGVYHLYYQHNPYGSMWGNMHWGHATSTDLYHWKYQPEAISPDYLGAIFSGSCVVDKENTAGFGRGAIVAIYTSAGIKQAQSVAYSTDGGNTFIKYEQNPVLTSTAPDFRDPKVMWYEGTHSWVMALAVGQEIQFYGSKDLKNWSLLSSFGHGQGAHGGVWECPDLFQLPLLNGKSKWVLIVNLNPGAPLGGSATQYFTGSFDGVKFTNDATPATTKWMDYGKDLYATVTWSNAPQERRIALGWMANWQYANMLPTKQSRCSTSIPRELSLYTYKNETYLASNPTKEIQDMRQDGKVIKVATDMTLNEIPVAAYEMEMTVKGNVCFDLYNKEGEKVTCKIDTKVGTFSLDRTKSGITSFSKYFPAIAVAPLEIGKKHTFVFYLDKASIEVFGDKGHFAMTNLVYPASPYNKMKLTGGESQVISIKVNKLK
jgi:fructan beta-fructosidase